MRTMKLWTKSGDCTEIESDDFNFSERVDFIKANSNIQKLNENEWLLAEFSGCEVGFNVKTEELWTTLPVGEWDKLVVGLNSIEIESLKKLIWE